MSGSGSPAGRSTLARPPTLPPTGRRGKQQPVAPARRARMATKAAGGFRLHAAGRASEETRARYHGGGGGAREIRTKAAGAGGLDPTPAAEDRLTTILSEGRHHVREKSRRLGPAIPRPPVPHAPVA